MANRSSFKSNVTTKIQPLMTTTIHRDVLNSDLADNIVFGEDVAVVQNSGSTNITVDFTAKDRIDLTRTGGALNITVAGMGDGEKKYLLVTKTTGQAITWVGITDITPIKTNTTAVSKVLYEIVRKSSYYYCRAWMESVKTATETIEGVLEIATVAESNALSVTDKIVTPGRIPLAKTTQKGVSELATVAEANALTDATRPVTPGTVPQASTTQKGVIEVATAAENDAGTAGFLAVIASELKRKYDALVALLTTKTAVTFSGVTVSPFSTSWISGVKNNSVRVIRGEVVASSAIGLKFIKTIDGYVSPGNIVPFTANHTNEATQQGGGGYIDTLGDIYMAVGAAGTWQFTIVVIY